MKFLFTIALFSCCILTQAQLEPFQEGKKFGLVNSNGNIEIDPIYDDIKTTEERHFIVKLDKMFGLLDSSGNKILSPDYNNLSYYHKDLFIAQKGNSSGLISSSGEWIISPNFSSLSGVYDEVENCFIASMEKKMGVINIKGDTLLRFEYDQIELSYLLDRPVYEIQINKKQCIYDPVIGIIIPCNYDNIRVPKTYLNNREVFILEKDNQFGLVDEYGKELLPTSYEQIEITQDLYHKDNGNMIRIKQDGLWGLYSEKGYIVSEPQFDYIFNENEIGNQNMFLVIIGNKYGFINSKSGEIITEVRYSEMEVSISGDIVAKGKYNGNWYHIFNDGKALEIIEK